MFDGNPNFHLDLCLGLFCFVVKNQTPISYPRIGIQVYPVSCKGTLIYATFLDNDMCKVIHIQNK